MKKIINILWILLPVFGFSQGIFGKNPYKNQQDFDKQRLHYGYFVGFNFYDFKIDYAKKYLNLHKNQEIKVISSIGFNVGLVGNLRLIEYLDLRFEPGLYYARKQLIFPDITPNHRATRDVNATIIHLPILLKFSALRTGNVRPYLLAGFSESLNLSSYQDSKEDNYEGRFRVKKWSANYELGFGIDFYFPHFKFSPSIRGVFGLEDELVRDYNPNSPWTGNIESFKTRGVFINFSFH